jgi:hypothetical protein
VPGTGTVTFKYDPFGRRIYKSSPTWTGIFLYDRDNLIETVNGSGTELSGYNGGPWIDEALSELRAGTSSYDQQDGLGSVTSLSNSTGTLANTYSYDSFGNLTNSTGTLGNPFQFTGREFDSETGLRYYRSCKNAFGPSVSSPFCSEGCITGSPDDVRDLNRLIDAEPNSTVQVVE